MDLFFLVSFFIFGSVFGSFFNVVGIRLPKGESFHRDRSYCPHCEKQLRSIELIPVLSFLMQAGKCRNCRSKISIIYPTTELFTGLLFAFAYAKIGWEAELILALLLISLLMIVFVSDMYYMLIPNKLLLFFLPLILLARILAPLDPWYDPLVGALLGYGLLALIIILSKGGMGAGDMKLFGLLGIALGWKLVLLTFFLAAFFGALIGGGLMMAKKIERGQPIPFGPFIVLAALISYFYGSQMIDLYLSFL